MLAISLFCCLLDSDKLRDAIATTARVQGNGGRRESGPKSEPASGKMLYPAGKRVKSLSLVRSSEPRTRARGPLLARIHTPHVPCRACIMWRQ